MVRILLVAAALVALVGLSRYLRGLTPEKRKQFYKRLAVFGLVGVIFVLAVTGRLHFLAAVVAAVLPFVKKLWPLIRYVPLLRRFYQQAQASKKPAAGQGSRVTTNLLAMVLDHDSGDLDGEVLEGPYQGKFLSDLGLEELIHIHRVAQSDYQDSVAILEAYLDRVHGDSWREQVGAEQSSSSQESTGSAEMGLKEAFAILGVEDDATEEQVVQAHRKLMQKLHPDRGGNDYLAAQVNRAKDIILEQLNR